MTWLNEYRKRLLFVGCVFVILFAGGPYAKADFVFGEPMNMGSLINSSEIDASPIMTPDGLQLYFGSDRAGGLGGVDLWMSTRPSKDDEWEEPVNLGEPEQCE